MLACEAAAAGIKEDLIQSSLFILFKVKIGTGDKSYDCESDFEVE